MKERDCLAFIEDMVEAIDKILKYLDTVEGLKEFLQNDMVTIVELTIVERLMQLPGIMKSLEKQLIRYQRQSKINILNYPRSRCTD